MTHPSKLTCQETFARLDDYVDRELSPADLEAVRGHLQDCAQCAPLFRFQAGVLVRLQDTIARIRAPKGLLQDIMRRVAAEGDREDGDAPAR